MLVLCKGHSSGGLAWMTIVSPVSSGTCQGTFCSMGGGVLIFSLHFVNLYNIFSCLWSFVALAILQKLAAQFQEGQGVDASSPGVTLTSALGCVLS